MNLNDEYDPIATSRRGFLRRVLVGGALMIPSGVILARLKSAGIDPHTALDLPEEDLHRLMEHAGSLSDVQAAIGIRGHVMVLGDGYHNDYTNNAHSDGPSHSDYPPYHSDSGPPSHTDRAHYDTHTDSTQPPDHTDGGTHTDGHTDHNDVETEPPHGDGAPHGDSGSHVDYHGDYPHADHGDEAHNDHSDSTNHGDGPTHGDYHCDFHQDHTDHTDLPHQDFPFLDA